jgi:tRNA-dihydrouridine synthase A
MFPGTISVAPMMGWTDRHARHFLRLISKHTLLYTEMVTTGAILNGPRESLLKYHAGFDEVNLNVGCPSDRVRQGQFGACLMADPDLVADCVDVMQSRVSIPVTVKCRTGIDEMEEYSLLDAFVSRIAETGCTTFIVHARNAWLQGLSPKQNREIPPLKYDFVYRLKREHPHLDITINGGIKTLEATRRHLEHVDGVMLGREAYHNPYLLSEVDQKFYGATEPVLSRPEIIDAFIPYIKEELANGTVLHSITRHIHGLFLGCPNAKAWRRHLSENDNRADAGIEVVLNAAKFVEFKSFCPRQI